jgi:hypothetical protein
LIIRPAESANSTSPGEAIWYAEGDRQPFFWSAMRNRWQLLADSGLSILVGGVTAGLAGKIAGALDTSDVPR